MLVFNLGLHKTATSSLDEALNILGIQMEQDEETFNTSLSDEFLEDVVRERSDISRRGFPFVAFPHLLRELHPEAKFILTVRDEDSWWESAYRNWKNDSIPIHDWFYGGAIDRELYLNTYREHNAMIKKDFPEALVMDIVNGDGWEKLCPFLRLPFPQTPFPHKNISDEQLRGISE